MITTPNGNGPTSSMSASTLPVDIDALQQQFENMKVAERDRHNFVETMLNLIQSLGRDRQESTRALRAQEMLANTYQDRFEATEKQLDNLQRAIDCDLFVLVVIDGDNTLFKDEYVQDGIRGGQRAAQDLHQALFDHFKDKHYFKHDYKVVTKIYLNFVGISRMYSDASITFSSDSFQNFVQGFNKMHELMEIVDAGNGKEGADSKVKAEFSLFRRNLQCKQVVFAGSGDNGYGNFLRPCAPVSGKSESITLIEALPFAQELQFLSHKFETFKLDNIFRNTKISIRPVQRQDDAVRPLLSSPASVPALEPSNTMPVTYANISSGVSAVNGAGKAVPEERKATTANRSPRLIYVNQFAQRIDEPIENPNEEIVYRLKQRKLCNKHYLHGNCRYDFCPHNHGPPLSAVELKNLRCVARLTPCPSGLKCNDPDCYNGHRCQYGMECANWKKKKCWFGNKMHEVDVSDSRAVVLGA